jgi:predicted metalloendopeptidase
MPDDNRSAWLEAWCELPAGIYPSRMTEGLFASVNAGWRAQHPTAPLSLLTVLGRQADADCSYLIEERLGRRGDAGDSRDCGAAGTLRGLHRVFVSDFDSAAERASCLPDVESLSKLRTRQQLRDALAERTRLGAASPLFLQVRSRWPDGPAVVEPLLQPSPLPPTDFVDPEQVAAYVPHLQAMVQHVGASLSAERIMGVLQLDRALWTGSDTDIGARAEFPWEPFLDVVVGPRNRPWSAHLTASVRRRMNRWWAGSVAQQRDWMICRFAFDFSPFVSETSLVRNANFYAGRAFGSIQPRSRPERFGSFVRTVYPNGLGELYADYRHDPDRIDRARHIVDSLYDQALSWAGAMVPPAAPDMLDTLRTLTVELGQQRGDRPASRAVPVPTRVCDAMRQARSSGVAEVLARIDEPARNADWKIQPFIATAYYQRSINRVIVPWALMHEPLLGPDVPAERAFALFGTVVAHEMAHAVLPATAEAWTAFVTATSLTEVVDLYHQATGSTEANGQVQAKLRELAADAIGLSWAYRAFCRELRQNPIQESAAEERSAGDRFLAYWATRWRGTPAAGFAHIDRHPLPQLRCDLAAVYISQLARQRR